MLSQGLFRWQARLIIGQTGKGRSSPLERRLLIPGKKIESVFSAAESDLVFTNSLGDALNPAELRSSSITPLVKGAGLPNIRFHDLRHSTAATLLLSLGKHPKVVQDLLGHSQIAVTMDVYSHALPTMQREAMEDLNRLLSA